MKTVMMLVSLCMLLSSSACAGPSRYTTEPGFDRPGPAYETFVQTSDYQMHDLCRDACESQPRCRSYTYVKPGVKGDKAICQLKENVPPPVEDACCISAVKGGKPKQAAVSSLRLDWLGWDADKLGKSQEARMPDGAADHHLRLALRLPKATQVVAIELREDGTLPNAIRWNTRDAGAQYLAAELNGRRLNPAPTPTLGEHEGNAVFDLYAHDIGQWNGGGVVVAEVQLGDGRRVTHTVTMGSPPDRLLGRWQMHCQSSSPAAFEPMSIDGRVLIIPQPDGTVTGYFSAMPLTGKLDSSGKIVGSAEDKSARVEFEGQLEKRTRGKPVRGHGSFKFVRAPDGCVGPGMWSNL